MSVRTMARVWAESQHAGTELLMLLAIADFADDDGNAYPAVASLARKCRMTPRNANHILAALKKSGELQIRMNEGPKGTNRYRVMAPDKPLKPASPLKGASPLKPTSPTPEAGFLKPLKPASDEPSLNHHEPKRRRAKAPLTTPLPEGFAISQAVREWASKKGFAGLLDEHFEYFVGYALANAKSYADWDQALMNAIRADWGDVRKNSGGGNRGRSELRADEQFRSAI